MKNIQNEQKIFLIINLSFFGDVLLTNTLCQNIKLEYPNSKIIFLVNKPFYEAAKYQCCVDDVIWFDKRNEHKGLSGLLKFVKNCEYKNKIYAAFVIYGNQRGIILSYLLKAKFRISGPRKYVKYLLTHIVPKKQQYKKMQNINANFIKALTGKKSKFLPIKYNVNPKENVLTQELFNKYKGKDIIGLCCVSKDKEKDMPIETAIELIKKLNENNKTVFLFGAGNPSKEYAENLEEIDDINFVNLINSTSIYDMANIISICKGFISVDTGTMHLSYAVQCPTVCLFYKDENIEKWAPNPYLYNVSVIEKDFSVSNIYNKLTDLLN